MVNMAEPVLKVTGDFIVMPPEMKNINNVLSFIHNYLSANNDILQSISLKMYICYVEACNL